MLSFARAGLRSSTRLGFNKARCFHQASILLQEQKKKDDGVKNTLGTESGTSVHGYDPLKPRKPLSRIAVGSKADIEREKQASTVGFLNWKAALIFIVTGGALTWYLQREKKRINIQKEADANRGYGKPLVGGPFKLIDQNGNEFTDKDLLGKYSLIYFGFSMCPDICPDELEKMSEVIDVINKDGEVLKPIFITCDPNRDSPEVLKAYLQEFHPAIIGLTGSYDEIKETCKKYRVYFSTPPNLKAGDEYLVDHSIFFYLMDPEGNFIDALGRNYDAQGSIERIQEQMAAWMPADQRENQKKGWLGGLFDSK